MPEKRPTSLIFKFSILFLLLILVILLTFAALMASILRISLKQTEEMVGKEHEQIVGTIDRYLDALEDIGFSVSYSSVTQDYLQKDSVYRVTGREEMKSLYLSITTMMRDVQGFYLYDEAFGGILSETAAVKIGLPEMQENIPAAGTSDMIAMIAEIRRQQNFRNIRRPGAGLKAGMAGRKTIRR